MRDRVKRLLEVHEAHIKWLLMLVCLVHQHSKIRDLVSSPATLSESCMLVCNFCFGLHSDPIQYDDIAIFVLKRDVKLQLTNFPGHSPVCQIATHILCILSSAVSPPALNSSAGTTFMLTRIKTAIARA